MADFARSLRTLAMLELVALVTLFNVMVWILAPMASSQTGALVYLGFMLAITLHVTVISRRLYPDLPWPVSGLAPMRSGFLRVDTLWAGAHAYGLAIIAGCGLVFVAGRMTGMTGMELRLDDIAIKSARYLMFAAVQAYVYFEFLLPRLKLAMGTGDRPTGAALVLAGLFMIAHAPNPYLMLATSIAGFVWALLYASVPNYFWVVLSHAILGTSVQIMTCWPTRTGPAFWNPDYFVFRTALKQLLALTMHP